MYYLHKNYLCICVSKNEKYIAIPFRAELLPLRKNVMNNERMNDERTNERMTNDDEGAFNIDIQQYLSFATFGSAL